MCLSEFLDLIGISCAILSNRRTQNEVQEVLIGDLGPKIPKGTCDGVRISSPENIAEGC